MKQGGRSSKFDTPEQVYEQPATGVRRRVHRDLQPVGVRQRDGRGRTRSAVADLKLDSKPSNTRSGSGRPTFTDTAGGSGRSLGLAFGAAIVDPSSGASTWTCRSRSAGRVVMAPAGERDDWARGLGLASRSARRSSDTVKIFDDGGD